MIKHLIAKVKVSEATTQINRYIFYALKTVLLGDFAFHNNSVSWQSLIIIRLRYRSSV